MKKISIRKQVMAITIILLAALGITAACTQTQNSETAAEQKKMSPELTALLERAAIEDLFNDYYLQFGPEGKHDFMSFFTKDGRLEVNGLIADGYDAIKEMYTMSGSGGQELIPEKEKNPVPLGQSRMMYTNLKIDLNGERAVVTLLWHSIKSDLLTSPPKVTEYGTEWTEVVKQNGRWLISKRVILSEGGMPEALLESYPKK